MFTNLNEECSFYSCAICCTAPLLQLLSCVWIQHQFRQVLKPFLISPGLCYFTGQRFVVGHSWTFSCPHTSWEQLGSKGGGCKICLISIRWLKQVLNSLIIWENPRHNWPVLCGKYTNPIIMSNEAMQQLMSDETLWGHKHFNKIKYKTSQEYFELWPNKAGLAALMIAKSQKLKRAATWK